MSEKDNIALILKQIPDEPGVYLMKDNSAEIIYIGKALRLKRRVASYFQQKKNDPKTTVLVSHITDIEYIVTDSEIEALILESNLVKKHRPKFNIRLKDDKRFPYIAITLGDTYPRIIFTRKISNRKSKYYGPYTDAAAARNMVHMVNTVFKLRTCKKDFPLKKGERPCLNHQIKRCSGVCEGTISPLEYTGMLKNAMHFLDGDIDPVLADLNMSMNKYSQDMNFEKAAQIRDVIFNIQKISQTQKVSISIGQDQDFLNVGIIGSEALLVLFEFRKGVLLGRKINVFDNASLSEPRDIIRTFIMEYYQYAEIPGRIITDYSVDDRAIIEEFLTSKASKKVIISQPATPEERGILDMIKKNIGMIIADREAAKYYQNIEEGLKILQEVLSLKELPEEMVCFDISNLQGTNAVASMVTFRNGAPDKNNYRRFKIRGHEGPNDPAMIHEAVGRRIQHLVNENLPMPDLMVIDGGPTQLTRAMEAAANFNVELTIVSLAKRFEEIYVSPKEPPIRLSKDSPALKILQNLRDESHRFAITYHKNLRAKEFTSSKLDEIAGISEKTRKILLAHFESIDKIKEASLDDLAQVKGIGQKTADAIYFFFRGNSQ